MRSLFLATTMGRWSWLATILGCCSLFYGGLSWFLAATMDRVSGYYFGSLAPCSWYCLRSWVLVIFHSFSELFSMQSDALCFGYMPASYLKGLVNVQPLFVL